LEWLLSLGQFNLAATAILIRVLGAYMKISGINPETNAIYEIEAPNMTNEFIQSMLGFELTEEQIKRVIDNLNISAEAKSLLYSLSKATIKVGDYILKIGRKIIEYVYNLFKQFKHAGFGLIFGAIAGILISSVPIIGFILGPIITPLLMIFGMIKGIFEDMNDKQLERKIIEINSKFSAMKAA